MRKFQPNFPVDETCLYPVDWYTRVLHLDGIQKFPDPRDPVRNE